MFKAPTRGKKTMRPQEVYKEECIIFPPVRRMDRQKKAGKGLETFHKGKTITRGIL